VLKVLKQLFISETKTIMFEAWTLHKHETVIETSKFWSGRVVVLYDHFKVMGLRMNLTESRRPNSLALPSLDQRWMVEVVPNIASRRDSFARQSKRMSQILHWWPHNARRAVRRMKSSVSSCIG